MSKKLLALSFLALSLAACGNLKKSADDPTKSGGNGNAAGGPGTHLGYSDFESQCTAVTPSAPGKLALSGTISKDNSKCLVGHPSVTVAAGTSGKFTIWATSGPGTGVVTSGDSHSVRILYNGHNVGSAGETLVPWEKNEKDPGGALVLDVRAATDTTASATAYDCFDRDLGSTWCSSLDLQ